MEKITFFAPAYDKRSSDPKKDYGIGCMRCYMVLKGEKGAVNFTFFTGMFLESTMEEYIKEGRAMPEVHDWGVFYINKPRGMDVGFHSLTPLYDYQKEYGPRDGCEWLDGKPCYGDGSALRAGEWMKIFLSEGSDKIWEMLEVEYKERFEEGK